MPRIKFDWTLNVGHIAIVLSAIGSVLIAYTNIVRSQDNHEFRLSALETQARDASKTNKELLSTLGEIKEEISALNVKVERQR